MAQSAFTPKTRFTVPLDRKGPDNPLADFPRSEHWRLVTDWQQVKGITDFTDKYYDGMQAGYAVMQDYINHKVPLSTDLIRKLQAAVFKPFADEETKDLNFRTEFVMFLIAPEAPEGVGLSQDGVADFVKAARQAHDEKRWRLVSVNNRFQEEIERNEGVQESKAEANLVAHVIKKKEKLFLYKDQLTAEKMQNYFDDDAKESLYICALENAQERLHFLERDIAEFEEKVPEPKKAIAEKEKKEVEEKKEAPSEAKIEDDKADAMIFFVQKLNQNHWFPDGNGRTCMILLNCFLIKYFNTMAIIRTPGHVTGFSMPQLIQELKDGIKEFEKYKITAARKFIEDFANNQELKDQMGSQELVDALKGVFSTESHIAMAQINEVFLRIKENDIKIENEDERDIILNYLKFLYVFNLGTLVNEQRVKINEEDDNVLTEDAFLKMHDYQNINDYIEAENKDYVEYIKKHIAALFPHEDQVDNQQQAGQDDEEDEQDEYQEQQEQDEDQQEEQEHEEQQEQDEDQQEDEQEQQHFSPSSTPRKR